MILGDFNADGAYISDKEMKEIRIRSDNNFHWLIGDDVDTTANTGNEHTYDRHVDIPLSNILEIVHATPDFQDVCESTDPPFV